MGWLGGVDWWVAHEILASHNTRREVFATDSTFFEPIFNVLTIVGTLVTAPWKTHEH